MTKILPCAFIFIMPWLVLGQDIDRVDSFCWEKKNTLSEKDLRNLFAAHCRLAGKLSFGRGNALKARVYLAVAEETIKPTSPCSCGCVGYTARKMGLFKPSETGPVDESYEGVGIFLALDEMALPGKATARARERKKKLRRR